MPMENPFKKLGEPKKSVPKKLKKKVMDDVAALQLFMEFTSLFSTNYAKTIESFLKNRNKKSKNN